MLFYPYKTVYYQSKLSKLEALERLVEQVQPEQESLEYLFEQVIKKPFSGKIEWGKFFLYVNGVKRPKKGNESPFIEGQFHERKGNAFIQVDFKSNGLKLFATILMTAIFIVSFLPEWWYSSKELEVGKTLFLVLSLIFIAKSLIVFHFISKSAHQHFAMIFEAVVIPREEAFKLSN